MLLSTYSKVHVCTTACIFSSAGRIFAIVGVYMHDANRLYIYNKIYALIDLCVRIYARHTCIRPQPYLLPIDNMNNRFFIIYLILISSSKTTHHRLHNGDNQFKSKPQNKLFAWFLRQKKK